MDNTEEDKNLTYEQLRDKKIARNRALLESLGLGILRSRVTPIKHDFI